MITRQKAAIISIFNTNISAVVLATAGEAEFEHYFATSDLVQITKNLVQERVRQLGEEQGRAIIVDKEQFKDFLNNVTHHLMSFSANAKQQEAVVFDGFNEQGEGSSAIQITLKVKRTELMSFDSDTKREL